MRRPNEPRSGCGLHEAMLVVGLAMGLTMIPRGAHSTIPVHDLWAPDGEVRAVAQGNNTVYLGGTFSHVGPVSGSAVALDLGTAVAQAPYPKVNGRVNAVEPDGSGGWYIGGSFTTVQGRRRDNLAQIDAAGQVTSWNPGTNGEVYDIAVGDGVVYVAGQFTDVFVGPRVGVVVRFGAAAIDASTGVATHWTPSPDGISTGVEVGGGKVYLAGYFTAIYYDGASGQPRPCLAEFTEVVPGDPTTGALTELFAGSDPSLDHIGELELSGGKLFFVPVTSSDNYLRIYDVTAGAFLPYIVTASGPIYAIALDQANGVFFIGGAFGHVQGIPLGLGAPIAKLDLATGFPIPWSDGTDDDVLTLAVVANKLLVGGEFSILGGLPRRGLGLVDLVAGVSDWDAACRGDVRAVAVDGATVYAGGEFSIVNSVPRSNLAAIDEASGAALAWNATANATVEALMVSGSTVYMGGKFSSVNGTTRNRAAAVDAVTGALTAFNPNVEVGLSTTVKAFAISGSTVYMGGVFGTVRGVERIGIAAVSATTGALFGWDPGSNGGVYSISYVPGGVFGGPIIVVGGDFTFIGGQFRNYVATLDPSTGASGALDSPNGPVHSMFVEPVPAFGGFNEILIGGPFTSIAGQPRNHIGSLAAFGLVTSWNPNANGVVYAIAKVGSTRFVGGAFTTIGGQDRTAIAAIDANGMATAWDPHPAIEFPLTPVLYSVLESGGTLYAGGTFTSIAETRHSHFAGMGQTVTAVESEPAPGVTPMALRAAPNPFEHSTMVQFSLASGGKARVAVFDVAGRRIRELHNGWLPTGRHTMAWDGRDGSGQPVGAGIYFLGVRTQDGQLGSKVYRMK